ncbi:FBP domain-containing protein [Microbacterium sp. p3-SID336]|uniref:FBP domain-containing protein n=1 Tax=Microbacterium sp. p3-SID336 TaxID=2916212 RepID=UPI0021A6E0E2|nr:FBP domain-containing protein [Microbacterium sp. p3-SID336]MCT1478967.1 FBP domain-containing protein [Microbacterium sp. p3-SID336]
MRTWTVAELRTALRNASDRERRTMQLPKGMVPDWPQLDYLGWRDPRAPQRGYLFVERDGALEGILLRHSRVAAVPSRAVMCTLCRIPRRFDQVVLFTATGESSERALSSRGTQLCADLDCHTRVNALRPTSPLEPEAEELVAERRAGLRERAQAFVADVLEMPRHGGRS